MTLKKGTYYVFIFARKLLCRWQLYLITVEYNAIKQKQRRVKVEVGPDSLHLTAEKDMTRPV